MNAPIEFKNRIARIEGPLPKREMQLVRARITEGLSQITDGRIEFVSDKDNTDISKIIGQPIELFLDCGDNTERAFSFACISVEHLGSDRGMELYVAEVRSWMWFLTRNLDSRIFQDVSFADILQTMTGETSFGLDAQFSLESDYPKRDYCVQHEESTYDFLYRLAAEEGVYFRTAKAGTYGEVEFVDHRTPFPSITGEATIPYANEGGDLHAFPCIYDLTERKKVIPKKVTLDDYNPMTPKLELKALQQADVKSVKAAEYEIYRHPGHIVAKNDGAPRTKVRMAAAAVADNVLIGKCTAQNLEVGRAFTLQDHWKTEYNRKYAVTGLTHWIEIQDQFGDPVMPDIGRPDVRVQNDLADGALYYCDVAMIPADRAFCAPFVVPWPRISGIQTAVVTGPSGDEIYVDAEGRIKVQFHWDREGKLDQNTSVWMRVATPWSGNGYGMVAWPRIGQEVIVQFENGDPDRPLCTGMLYNKELKHPEKPDVNFTQTGIKTRSTKQGTSATCHELIFEDKKGAEFVRLQSERDYMEIIKNNASISIGEGHQDDGDLTQTIFRNKTETLLTGDHTFHVKEGDQDIFVKGDSEEKIEGDCKQDIVGDTVQLIRSGDYKQTINSGDSVELIKTGDYKQTVNTGDVKQTIKTGDYKQTVNTGHVVQTIKSGNYKQKVNAGHHKQTVATGNYEIKANAGKVEIKAGQEIVLKVGMSEIKIDNTGVSIKGLMVKVDGKASAEVSGLMTKVEGKAMLTLKGGVAMIN